MVVLFAAVTSPPTLGAPVRRLASRVASCTPFSNFSGLRDARLCCKKRLGTGVNRRENMLPAKFFRNATAVEHHAKQPLRAGNCQNNATSCQLRVEFLQCIRPANIKNRDRLCIEEKPLGLCVCILNNGARTVFEMVCVEEQQR